MNFCAQCGTRLADHFSQDRLNSDLSHQSLDSNQSNQPERRPVTIVFCDLVGSTPLSSRLDADDYFEVLRVFQAQCSAVVELYNGYVAQHLGDGLLCYFGYPTAALHWA